MVEADRKKTEITIRKSKKDNNCFSVCSEEGCYKTHPGVFETVTINYCETILNYWKQSPNDMD